MVLASPWPRSDPTPTHSDPRVAIKFDYEDLSDAQFETLVVFLRQRLLGISVQGFAKGPDGGRDAKFVGTAELHPSGAAPWIGTTIIQDNRLPWEDQVVHTDGRSCGFPAPTRLHNAGDI